MIIEIAQHGENMLRTHKCGYGVETEESKRVRCTGKLKEGFKKLGWPGVTARLDELSDEFYARTKAKGSMAISFPGAVGEHKATHIPQKQCVELTLVYEPQGKMARHSTAVQQSFPAHHGQSIVSMICAEIEHHSLKNGPFTSEEQVIAFIEDIKFTADKAIESGRILEASSTVDEDDDGIDDDNIDEDEDAA